MEDPAAEERIRVAIVDDHTLFREGIKELLSTVPLFEVIAEGSNGHDALELVPRLDPDVLLLDVQMPGPSTRTILRQLRQTNPRTRIVVLTMHEESALVQELLDQGASAYLVKTIASDELVAAVRSVARSQSTVLLQVSRETFAGLDRSRPAPNLLSDRELEVLRLAAAALSNTQIARRLFITEGTVKRHLTNIYAKLNAVSRVDAVRKATAARLISPTDELPGTEA